MERPHVDIVRFFRWKWRCSPQKIFSIKISKSPRLIFLSTGANLRLLELTHLPCRAKTSRSNLVLPIFWRDLLVYQTNWIDPNIISIPCWNHYYEHIFDKIGYVSHFFEYLIFLILRTRRSKAMPSKLNFSQNLESSHQDRNRIQSVRRSQPLSL